MGSGSSDYYVCRMKADGTSFTKLGRGFNPVIYDNKIYYFQTTHINTGDGTYDDIKGIAVMSLVGKNSKMLVKNSTTNFMKWSMGVSNRKIYYSKYLASAEKNVAMAYDLKTGKTQKLFTKTSEIGFINADPAIMYSSIP